jgi:type I restriction enzyme M protein
VLDEFKSAGVFVNWWQAIRYDLKTVISTGWHHTLILDSYLIAEYFQQEADEIEALEGKINEAQGVLADAVEAAAETANYEPEEIEGEDGETKLTATVIKKYLKSLIDDLSDARTDSARKERKQFDDMRDGISAIEKRIKGHKDRHRIKQGELEQKLQLKRIGGEEVKEEIRTIVTHAKSVMQTLNPDVKDQKKKLTALQSDLAVLEERLALIDDLLAAIGGQLSEADAKRLILKKLHDVAGKELLRYLNAEKRALLAIVEKLWDKYAVSSQSLEMKRDSALKTLNGYFADLGYLG